MLFRLTNVKTNRITHCGVLEFVADEGKVYLPYWMMRNLLLNDEGEMIRIESTSLPVAVFSKFQPQSVNFLDITTPKAVLENALRNFAGRLSRQVMSLRLIITTKCTNCVFLKHDLVMPSVSLNVT